MGKVDLLYACAAALLEWAPLCLCVIWRCERGPLALACRPPSAGGTAALHGAA